MAGEKWKQYIQCQNRPHGLSYLTEQNLHSDMQRKAMNRLMGLRFKVVYRQNENMVADALSRMDHLMVIQLVSTLQSLWIQEVGNS